MISGRDFTERDDTRAPGVLIVSQSFAQRYFPDENPIGKHVEPGFAVTGQPVMREIIGVVADIKHHSLDTAPHPDYYIPYAQGVMPLTICVRSAGIAPLALLPEVKEAIANMDSDLPLYDVRLLEDYVSASLGQQRFQAFLFGTFALLALLLTGVGLYGVMAYSVAQRTHEIGVRMSMGATSADVLNMVLKSAIGLTGIGLIAGIAVSLVLTRFLEGMLFGIQRLDLVTFCGVTALLLLVALLASYIPAKRATRVEPTVALRYE
jgi:predicted permease